MPKQALESESPRLFQHGKNFSRSSYLKHEWLDQVVSYTETRSGNFINRQHQFLKSNKYPSEITDKITEVNKDFKLDDIKV